MPEAKAKQKFYLGTGRRKTAVARVRIRDGNGVLEINDKPMEVYFPDILQQRPVRNPLEASDLVGKIDCFVNVQGGGISGQANSVTLAARMNALIDEAGTESVQKRLRAKLLVGMSAEFLHASLLQTIGVSLPHLDQTAHQALEAFRARTSPERIAASIERTVEADYHIDRKASVPLVIETWLDEVVGP